MAIVSKQDRAPEPAPSSFGANLPLRKLAFRAMATQCEVQYTAPAGNDQAKRFEAAAQGWVHAFEAKFSRFQPGSVVSKINEAAGREWVPVDAETEGLLSMCDTLHFMTRGILDPSALPLIRIWDGKADPPAIPTPEAIAAALSLVGWTKVKREPGRVFLPQEGMALDFGGFGREYAVDLVSLIAKDHGILDSLVGFGRDLRATGAPPGGAVWRIGLEDPGNPDETLGSVGLTGNAVASSGNDLRPSALEGRRHGRIINPRTGWPVANGCTQATVIADTCLQAGMLSVSAFIAGVEQGLELIRSCPGAEGIILTGSERAQTRGFFNFVAST